MGTQVSGYENGDRVMMRCRTCWATRYGKVAAIDHTNDRYFVRWESGDRSWHTARELRAPRRPVSGPS